MSEMTVNLEMLSRQANSFQLPIDKIPGQPSCPRCGEMVSPEGQCSSMLRFEHDGETGNVRVQLFLECGKCGYDGPEIAFLDQEINLLLLDE